MTVHGLALLAPGLVLVGLAGMAQSVPLLYLGLLLLALGAAQATPCLTALASLYAPAHDQGRVLGVFRSLGALARALGPLSACLLYWQVGGSATYFLGALAVALPLWLALRLPDPAAAAH
jgi:MFS family permease